MSSPSSRLRMFRQQSQRYSRANLAKGLKVKHILQIAIVILVVTWVTYELNLTQKPASKTGSLLTQDTEQDKFLGRKALKPEGGPGKFDLEIEKDIPTDPDITVTESLQGENFDGSRTEEDFDDQRDRDISELDMEHATDQDEKTEDEGMPNDVADVHDVGTDFEELKNEQARVEQDESGENGKDGKDGDFDEDSDSQSQNNIATTSDDASTEGGSDDNSHLASVVDKEKIAREERETTFATYMDAFNADSVLKPRLDKLDEGETDNTSRAHLDENRDSATDALGETGDNSGQEVAMENSADQVEEISEKEVEDETVDTSEDSTVSDATEDNVNDQSEVEGTQSNLDTQSNEQSDTNREKTEDSVESREEGQVDDEVETQEQRQEPEHHETVEKETQSQQPVEGDEKPEEKLDTQSRVPEQEEKKQEEGVEKKVDDTQTQQETEVKNTGSNSQPELKSAGADVEVEKKTVETQTSEGESKQPEAKDDDGLVGSDVHRDRLAIEENIQHFQEPLAEKKEEAEHDHNSGETQNDHELQRENTEQKKDESVETNSAKSQESQVKSDNESAEGSSDSSDTKMEKNSQEGHSAETVNKDASTQDNSKQEGESSKGETLKQETDSNAAGSGVSNTKIEDHSAEKSNESDQVVTNIQQE